MTIGIYSGEFQTAYGYEKAFDGLRKIGYDAVDFTLGDWKKPNLAFKESRKVWTAEFKRARAALDAAGMFASQSHATFPTDISGEGRLTDAYLDEFKKEIEAAAIIGSPYIVIHPINLAMLEKDKERDFEVNMESFGRLEPVLREFDMQLGVENMFGWDPMRSRRCPTGCSLPEDMIRYIDSMHSDRFVACLDTGHMNINSVNPATAVRKLGSRLKLLHVHDNYGVNDEHSAPTQGTIDWHDFAAALAEIGYDGCFNMEVIARHPAALDPELTWDYARYAYACAKKIVALSILQNK